MNGDSRCKHIPRRDGGIRTRDLPVPNGTRYRAALHPEVSQYNIYCLRIKCET